MSELTRRELFATALSAAALPAGIDLRPGAVNQVGLGNGIWVYGCPADARVVLFASGRRDVRWAGEAAVKGGARAYAPEGERAWFESPQEFWAGFEKARFHDYAQQTTKVPVAPLPVHRFVKEGETVEDRVQVLSTPGYSPRSVTYLASVGGRRIAFPGDLIWGEQGQLLDLYSLQDAVPETKTRGYHGYAARAGALMASLRRIAAAKPDLMIPARGPVIENPAEAIESLITRLKALLQNHFSTDALRWYWGYESLRQRARSAGLTEGVNEVMPFGEEARLPEWVVAIGNSRVLRSRSGGAFLIDAGYAPLQGELEKRGIQTLEGIWVTHYHDDHTDHVARLAQAYDAPVHCIASIQDILQHPGHYRMPASTHTPTPQLKAWRDGERMRWQEYEFQFFEFPGQTIYHGGLRVKPPNGPALFFAGDSFTPAGMDDYCLLNRNLLSEGTGYLYCLDVLEKLGGKDWILNQHVDPMFRFTREQYAYMRKAMHGRRELTRALTPLPGADYGVDESWARIYPYATETIRGTPVRLDLRSTAADIRLRWNLPEGWRASSLTNQRLETVAATPGLHVITADVAIGGIELRHWTEALVRVKD